MTAAGAPPPCRSAGPPPGRAAPGCTGWVGCSAGSSAGILGCSSRRADCPPARREIRPATESQASATAGAWRCAVQSGRSRTVPPAGASSRGSSATRSGRAPRKPWTTVSGDEVMRTSLPAAISASSSNTAGLASCMSSTRTSWSLSRSAARKSGSSWKIWRAAVIMPAGSKDSGMRRSSTSRYSAYRAAAATQSGRWQRRARTTRSPAVRPDSMIRSKSWRTSCRKPRVCRAAPRSSGQGSSSPGCACPSSSSLMIRSCSGPDRSFGGRGSGRMPSALARRIRSKAYDAQVRAGVVLRLRSSRAVKRSRSESAARRPGARMSIRSGSRPSRCARRTAASTSTVDLPVPGAPGTRTGPEPCGTSTAASWSVDSTGTALCSLRGGSRRSAEPEMPGVPERAGRGPPLADALDVGLVAAGCGWCGLCCCGLCCCGRGGLRVQAGDAHTVISSSGADSLCRERSSRSATASIRSNSPSPGAQRAAIRSTRQRPSPVRRYSA